jgi:peptidoglycan lytic transglycosylase D
MQTLFILCLTLVFAFPALAADPSGRAAAAGSMALSGTSSAHGSSFDLVASLVGDSRLISAPGLLSQPQDDHSDDEVATDDLESELVLPDETLPESDIPLTFNSKVEYFVNYFQTVGRTAFGRWLSRSERYIPMMKEVLQKEGLPEDLVYLAMIESGFTPHAYSVASAVGPWQFMSGTGKRYSLRIDGWIDERRDPMKSTVAAALYLKELYGIFNKDWYLAAAGYNAGENKILRAIGMYNSNDFWQLSKGSYLKRETKEYVPKLIAAAIIAKEPAKYGFADVAYLPPIEFDTVTIPAQTDLDLAARLCGVSLDTIRTLNPELRRWATPPDYPGYQLKIPRGKKDLFVEAFAKVPETARFTERTVTVRHRAGRKETLAAIAGRYDTTAEAIAAANGLKKNARVGGKLLLVPVKAALLDRLQDSKKSRASVSGKGLTRYYTVKKGDTLHAVAKRFNVSTRLLSLWNNLKEKVALRAGKRIIVAKFVKKDGSLVPVGERS